MFTVTEPQIQAPEVYRSTPFEYLMTAEPGHTVVTCTILISAEQRWVAKTAPFPDWMGLRLNTPRPIPQDIVLEELQAAPVAYPSGPFHT